MQDRNQETLQLMCDVVSVSLTFESHQLVVTLLPQVHLPLVFTQQLLIGTAHLTDHLTDLTHTHTHTVIINNSNRMKSCELTRVTRCDMWNVKSFTYIKAFHYFYIFKLSC